MQSLKQSGGFLIVKCYCGLGHMRHLVIQACTALDIPVSLEPPSIDQVDTWDEMFLASMYHILSVYYLFNDQSITFTFTIFTFIIYCLHLYL